MKHQILSLLLAACSIAAMSFAGGNAQAGSPTAEDVRKLLEAHSVTPMEKPKEFSDPMLKLGQALFFDPLLGGNQDVACATCHHPQTFTSDGRSRSVGTRAYVNEGRRMPEGLRLVSIAGKDPVLMGFDMNKAAHPFTPRNAPDCFNRGDSEWKTMFWDTRVNQREDGRFYVNQMRLTKSPGYYQVVMPEIIKDAVAAQAMMPVLSNAEMRGTKGETGITGAHNEVGEVLGMNEEEIWAALMKRILSIDEYRQLFTEAYPGEDIDELHFAYAANAIGAFEIDAFTFLDSPWDKFLEGDDSALNEEQLKGADLFYGKADCVSCHTGRLMTDQQVYNIGIIPIGPGPSAAEDQDFGAAHRSDYDLDFKWAFRTPPLRNVELTKPYMHNGCYSTLEAAVRHHTNPVYYLENYDKSQLEPEFRGAVHDSPTIIRDIKSTMPDELKLPNPLSDEEVNYLVEFLKALTSPSARDLSGVIPEKVPSGLKMVLPFPTDD